MSSQETGGRLRKTVAEPMKGRGGTGRRETPLERWDRNFSELLQELRVAQTGVQVLFAFLLTLPFTNRFERITGVQRGTYVVTLVAAAAATALLIAPVSYHRLVFRQGRKPQLVRTGSKPATLGLGCRLVPMLGAVLLVGGGGLGAPRAGG